MVEGRAGQRGGRRGRPRRPQRASSVEERAGGMARRPSWTAVTGGTAAPGDDDETQREIARGTRNRSKSGVIYGGQFSTGLCLRPVLNCVLGHLVPGAIKARY